MEKDKKKKKSYNKEQSIRSALRRAFSTSPIVREVMSLVRREIPRFNTNGSQSKKNSVQYLCSECNTWTKSSEISVDHIEPVIETGVGFVDWNTFVSRLFCSYDNLRVVCNTCHDKKTQAETTAKFRIRYMGDLRALAEKVKQGLISEKDEKDELKKIIKKKDTPGFEEVSLLAHQMFDDLNVRIKNRLLMELEDFSLLVLQGRVAKKERNKTLKKFIKAGEAPGLMEVAYLAQRVLDDARNNEVNVRVRKGGPRLLNGVADLQSGDKERDANPPGCSV
jgi:5-methylcytosine-specific restriction endonuclease McrA